MNLPRLGAALDVQYHNDYNKDSIPKLLPAAPVPLYRNVEKGPEAVILGGQVGMFLEACQ